MTPAEVLPLFTQFGPGVAIFVLLLLLLVKLRDRVGGRVDESVEEWIDRLEGHIERLERELKEERDVRRRYMAAREAHDAAHRRWDSRILRVALSGGDVSKVPDPPPLTPHPSTYELPAPRAGQTQEAKT